MSRVCADNSQEKSPVKRTEGLIKPQPNWRGISNWRSLKGQLRRSGCSWERFWRGSNSIQFQEKDSGYSCWCLGWRRLWMFQKSRVSGVLVWIKHYHPLFFVISLLMWWYILHSGVTVANLIWLYYNTNIVVKAFSLSSPGYCVNSVPYIWDGLYNVSKP